MTTSAVKKAAPAKKPTPAATAPKPEPKPEPPVDSQESTATENPRDESHPPLDPSEENLAAAEVRERPEKIETGDGSKPDAQPVPHAATLDAPAIPPAATPEVEQKAPTLADATIERVHRNPGGVTITVGGPALEDGEDLFAEAGPGYKVCTRELLQTYGIDPYDRQVTTLLVAQGRVVPDSSAEAITARLAAQGNDDEQAA